MSPQQQPVKLHQVGKREYIESTKSSCLTFVICLFCPGTMTIILEDVNDHDPIFVQPFYRRSVAENSKRGAAILRLSADDADLNRSITYSLDGN